MLQGSLDGDSSTSCMPASSQTASGQSKTIYPRFFHIMEEINLSAHTLQAAFQAHTERKIQMRKTEIEQVN